MWLRFLASLTVQSLLFAAAVQVPAWALTGRWDWTRGWILVGIMFAAAALGGAWFAATDPTLVRERAGVPKPQSAMDGLATGLIGIALLAWFVAAAADVFRWRLMAPPPPDVSLWGGLAIFCAGLAIIVWTFRVNSFAATVVKVQDEQRVIDTGPYALVRHPMYFGALGFFAGAALILESPALAIATIPFFVLVFMPRMLVEEATLRRDLAGYAEYQRRVRARILPGLL
jgi:protein-S-isoprenylcysteine O-methyltransferase Ste14